MNLNGRDVHLKFMEAKNQKEIAVAFLKAVAMGKVNDGFEKYVGEDFIHHNPYFSGDKKSLKSAMLEDHKKNPNLSFEIQKIVEENETVVLYSKVEKKVLTIAVVHIFRFDEEKIAEMWDIGTVIPIDSPNKNGVF